MRSPSMATSARKAGWPVPSTTLPFRITRSCIEVSGRGPASQPCRSATGRERVPKESDGCALACQVWTTASRRRRVGRWAPPRRTHLAPTPSRDEFAARPHPEASLQERRAPAPRLSTRPERAVRRPAGDLDAWDFALRGLWHLNRRPRARDGKGEAAAAAFASAPDAGVLARRLEPVGHVVAQCLGAAPEEGAGALVPAEEASHGHAPAAEVTHRRAVLDQAALDH